MPGRSPESGEGRSGAGALEGGWQPAGSSSSGWGAGEAAWLPELRILDHLAWRGRGHDALLNELAPLLAETWRPQSVAIDVSGIGEGLAAGLLTRLGVSARRAQVLRIRFSEQIKSPPRLRPARRRRTPALLRGRRIAGVPRVLAPVDESAGGVQAEPADELLGRSGRRQRRLSGEPRAGGGGGRHGSAARCARPATAGGLLDARPHFAATWIASGSPGSPARPRAEPTSFDIPACNRRRTL